MCHTKYSMLLRRPQTFLSRRAPICHQRAVFWPGRACFNRRQFTTTNVRKFGPSADPPSVALAVGLALGLPFVLWTYKCLLMILLQRKLIYMGYAPPGAREENVTAYKDQLRGIDLEEIQLRNVEDNCKLRGIVLRKSGENLGQLSRGPSLVLIYLQGNAGNPLQRIPMFQALLHACSDLELAIVAVAPRSYWKSTRRTPTESGLLSDYRQVVEYARTRWPTEPMILYGHSLGASVGTCLTSRMSDIERVRGLILENPFSSIPDMVRALYPSRWLPYHYLGRFAWDKWDAVRATSEAAGTSLLGRLLRENGVFVVQSEHDEIVPLEMGRAICRAGKTGSSPLVIRGALHENAWESRQWCSAMRTILQNYLRRG